MNDTFDTGSGITGVVLQDGTVALVNTYDYQYMRAQGWIGRWTARKVTGDNQYPSINHGRRIYPIARLIVDAQEGERVYYRNGDRNDITRVNLILKAKGGTVIRSSERSCPMATALSKAERQDVIAKVASAVGSANLDARIAVERWAVERARPHVQAAMLSAFGNAA